MRYGNAPDDEGPGHVANRPNGTVPGAAGSRGPARIPRDGPPSGNRASRSGTGGSARGGALSRSPGTTYGSSASGHTTHGSAAAGTAYRSRGMTYGGTAVSDRPTGIGPRGRARTAEDDRLQPERGGLSPAGWPPGARKAKRKRILVGGGIAIALCMLLGLLGGGVAYAATDLPPIPNVSQNTVVQYADGSTLATFATQNRVEVKLSQVPKWVQNEVVSAEDQDYWNNGGVSIRGTGRAIWGLVTGNDSAGGGSTITQQYIRNALNLTRGRSYTRKVKEIILAQKLSSGMSKEQILQGYLNTIYFGRSAWGIQSASQAYFGKSASTLTPAEGAVLAAVIKDPTNFDPKNNLASAQARWTYVMDSMVKKGFMSATDRAEQVYPIDNQVLAKGPSMGTGAWRSGSTGVLGYRIEQELLKLHFSEQAINTGGLTVRTTISSAAQNLAAETSYKYVNKHVQDKRMATAMVSIDPRTGAVKAYYGGEGGYGSLDLASAQSPHPAGSSFKPYVLATGVGKGYGIDSVWDGTSGQKFNDRSTPLTNSDGESCGPQCSLTTATVKSLNTVYWALTDKVGVNKVAQTAAAAGIKSLSGVPIETKVKQGINAGIGLGQYSISVLDQASGYATLANYGGYHQPYFINEVADRSGAVLWNHTDHVAPETQAWTRDVGRDVSNVLEQVYDANAKNKIGRQGAIKTGTQQYKDTTENSHAWMCGYTPQLATAVWVGSGATDFPLRDQVNGNIHVYGNGIPGSIWRDFMVAALKKQKVVDFQSALHRGDKAGNAKTEPPSPSPNDTPSTGDNGNPFGENGNQTASGTTSPSATNTTNGNGTNPGPDSTASTNQSGGQGRPSSTAALTAGPTRAP
jgi:membrane peptidoglycan carboxypeptidase